jgi:hypothetical protein
VSNGLHTKVLSGNIVAPRTGAIKMTEQIADTATVPGPPLDLSHHYSIVTKQRIPSKMKEFYKFFQIPGIGNLAGGGSPFYVSGNFISTRMQRRCG